MAFSRFPQLRVNLSYSIQMYPSHTDSYVVLGKINYTLKLDYLQNELKSNCFFSITVPC